MPASPACRRLRYQGHALIDCLGKNYAYQSALDKGFHFASAGVAASVKAITKLRQALVSKPRKSLLQSFHRLQDDDAGVEALRKGISAVQSGDAELLLHGYAMTGRARLVEVLLKSGSCSVNAQRAKDGGTALHLAYWHDHPEVIKVLSTYGADTTIKNKHGETPVQAVKPPKI